MALSNIEINRLLQKLPTTAPYFCEVAPSDAVFSVPQHRPLLYVRNTQGSQFPGLHWVAIFVDKCNKAFFFDSNGCEPQKEFKVFLEKFSSYMWWKRQIQSPVSQCCGHYCIYFLFKCCAGKSAKNAMNRFKTSNLSKNDNYVQKWYHKMKLLTGNYINQRIQY